MPNRKSMLILVRYHTGLASRDQEMVTIGGTEEHLFPMIFRFSRGEVLKI